MAANPVFIASLASLKSQLRLTGASQPDALAMINTAIQQARIYLYRVLGIVRVGVIAAYSFNENAETENEISRLKANAVELALVRIYLLRTMPMLFMDASGVKREVWNEEGFARMQQKQLDEEIARLQLDIDTWLAELVAADGVLTGVVQGGILEAVVDCPLNITRSIQGGYHHLQDQYGGQPVGAYATIEDGSEES